MSAFNPTEEEIEQRVGETSFGRSLTAEQRTLYVRDMKRLAEKMPSPPKAALIGAGVGAAIALVAGRSMLKYGMVLGALSYAGMSMLDITFSGGYTMGFGAAAGKRG